jgi:hypothetical protein
MRKPSTFRQSDLTRAVKGMKAAGVEIAGAVIGNGRIVVVARTPVEASQPAKPNEGTSNPWDEVLDGVH